MTDADDMVTGLRSGAVLIATPELDSPTFRRTIIYLVSHSAGGSLGVVLNRPSETPVHNVLPQWNSLAARSQVVFVGGPMRPDAVGIPCTANSRCSGRAGRPTSSISSSIT